MGGAIDSAGGFLGLSSGPKNQMQTGNSALGELGGLNSLYGDPQAMQLMSDYGQGKISSNDVLNTGMGLSDYQRPELQNALATGSVSGSRYASEQVQNNPILGQLFGNGGELSKSIGKEQDLQNQGFELKPEDQTMYGQASGNIARQFGQQGNQMANSLASRGLSSSGAAGASFSGLAGNQNEQLARAQEQIMQQRFQNTQNQIAQQQNFIGNLGQQGASAINQQYGRQLQGAQAQKSGLESQAGLQGSANQANNQATLSEAGFEQQNKPANFMDYQTAGMGSSIYQGAAAPGKFMSSAAGAAGKSAGSGGMGAG